MKEKKFYTHLYEGNGKGKTSAAVGSAIRMAGSGGKVLLGQFLKSGTSSELEVLRHIPQITVLEVEKTFGFTFQMTEEVRKEAAKYYQNYFENAVRLAEEQQVQMLILDEFVDAYRMEFLDQDEALEFLKKPHFYELILTGHNPPTELIAVADYHTVFEMKKHPYEEGVTARQGIEF